MGITRGGRFAAITNHRNPPGTPEEPRSRGLLTLEYLLGDASPGDYLQALQPHAQEYAGFNLLLGDRASLWYLSNIEGRVRQLEPGVHSVSNATLDSNWPKQELARARLLATLKDHESPSHSGLQATVASRELVPDPQLPDSGIHIDMERMLSAQFIVNPGYGTRATTSMWVHREGEVSWQEDNFDPSGTLANRVCERFNLDERG